MKIFPLDFKKPSPSSLSFLIGIFTSLSAYACAPQPSDIEKKSSLVYNCHERLQEAFEKYKHTDLFSGFDRGVWEKAELWFAIKHQNDQAITCDISLSPHQRQKRLLDMLTQELRDFSNRIPHNPLPVGITIEGFYDKVLRLMEAPRELSFFEKVLFANSGREELIKKIFYKDQINETDRECFQTYKLIASAASKAAGPNFYAPMWNHCELSFSFLTLAFLNNVFPFPCSGDTFSYHGIPKELATPLGISAHDILHGYIKVSNDELCGYILDLINHAFVCGDLEHSEDRTKLVPENHLTDLMQGAIAKHKKWVTRLNDFYYEHLVCKLLLENDDLGEYKKLMTGFFLIVHEYNSLFHKKVYQQSTHQQMIHQAIQILTQGLDQHNAYENMEDPFYTSPVTGEPFLDNHIIGTKSLKLQYEQEIENLFCRPGLKDQPGNILVGITGIGRQEACNNLPLGFSQKALYLTFTKTALDAYGESIPQTIGIPTLYHKLLHITDLHKILERSGMPLKPLPDLESMNLTKARQAALETIKETNLGLKKILGEFEKAFIKYCDSI